MHSIFKYPQLPIGYVGSKRDSKVEQNTVRVLYVPYRAIRITMSDEDTVDVFRFKVYFGVFWISRFR